MKRRWTMLGTLALLLTGAAAEAQSWRDGGVREGRGRYGARPRYGGYGAYGSGGGRVFQPAYGFQGGDRRGYAPGGGGYGGGGGYRRGQVLPPGARGAYVPDPGRYHLRAAPPGYGWVGDGRNAYLTQRSTGMVLDSVPGAYDPAPRDGPGRGRRGRGPR